MDIAAPGVDRILNHFSSDLEAHWPDMMHALFARHPQVMVERTQGDNGFTLIHGDAGHNNLLVPREGDRPVYLIDQQPFNWSLTTWLGVYDLTYAMVSIGMWKSAYYRGGVNRQISIWLPMLKRSLTTCDDWDCRKLW